MKPALLSLIFATMSAAAFAQSDTTLTPPQMPGSSATGTMTMTGCVGGGIGFGPFTMMSPTITPATMQQGSIGSSAIPTFRPITPPGYDAWNTTPPLVGPILPPWESATGAVGTTGTYPYGSGMSGTTGTAGAATAGATGTLGTNPYPATAAPSEMPPGSTGAPNAIGPTGYRLTGADMNSWIGRRVQIVGTIAPLIPGASPEFNEHVPETFPEFRVQSVMPLTGVCPQS